MYAASARTVSGALAEMERLIGDALFAGYVGYNGRAPGGGAAKREEAAPDNSERNKSGGDARHTLVAYFEIVELSTILPVDKETANLAIRIFRHTASNTSLRNRNVESLATAAFVSAAERRWNDYQAWVKEKSQKGKREAGNGDAIPEPTSPAWPKPPPKLTVEEIAIAANLDTAEVLRYLKVVNSALSKQHAEHTSSITGHMPTYCRQLELPERTERLAIAIAEKAIRKNICSKRNPVSISAAAIYLACQMDGVRKTQTEICRTTSPTEVTLRKVYKELSREQEALVPDWYKEERNGGMSQSAVKQLPRVPELPKPRPSADPVHASVKAEKSKLMLSAEGQRKVDYGAKELDPQSLVPPPLPPGFREPAPLPSTARKVSGLASAVVPDIPNPPSTTEDNPLSAMINIPTMQAFANALSMIPQFMMPPPPPPPPLPSSTTTEKDERPRSDVSQDKKASELTSSQDITANKTVESKNESEIRLRDGTSPALAAANVPQNPANVMAGFQSMIGMMQAMQAYQTMQQRTPTAQPIPSEVPTPFAMMTAMMTQQGSTAVPGASSAAAAKTDKADTDLQSNERTSAENPHPAPKETESTQIIADKKDTGTGGNT